MVVRILRWLLPWACVFGLAAALAYAADLELVRLLAPLDGQPAHSASSNSELREIQIVFMHPDSPASVQVCMAYADNVTSDLLEFWESADVAQALQRVCVTNPRPDNGRGTH
jgi:hypothetical protein